MNKVENQISRMKSMMTYGLTTEGKNNQYKSVEYQREGADGKMYGIVREGTKFYIKVSDKKNNVIKEDFDYIGGFRNRKDNEYTSYANALKHFDLKMIGLNEAAKNAKHIVIESWNPDKKEELALESTEKMRKEIERQRQIMGNVNVIEENKNYSVNLDEECCGNACGKSCEKVDKECSDTQKDNIKKCKDGKGEPTGKGGDPFTEKPKFLNDGKASKKGKNEYKPVMAESEQVLGWNENPDYIDTTHGTEVGDDAPFTEGEGTEKEMKNGTVEEGVAMHKEGENQNSPAVGTGEVGDDAPFDKPISEAAEDDELDDVESDDTDLDGDEELDGDADFEEDDDVDFDEEGDDDDFDDDDDLYDEDEEESDLESRVASIEDLLGKIAEKLGVDAFDDDDLYDDDEESDDDFDEDGDVDFDEEGDDDDFDDDDDVEVYESRNYRKTMMNEDRLDYFGKHPAYRKEPMRLPSNRHQEMPGYEDINDESVEGEQPFGQQIGDGAPFEVSPEDITNAIAESIERNLKKKI